MFIARQIDGWNDILNQVGIWHRLHTQLAPDNPYASPQWSEIWFNTHAKQKRSKVFLLSKDDKGAEGIILLVKGTTFRFKLPVKSIESIGAGISATDRHYISVQEPLLTPKAIDPLFESINTLKGWAFFRLAPLLADDTFYQEVFTAAEKYGMTVFRLPYSIGYTIRTNTGWDEYERSRSKKFKKMLRAAENKMQKNGGFRIEAYTDAGSTDKLLDMLKAITMKSWKVKAGSDLFNPAYQGFWRMAFLKTIVAGQTTLWILYHQDHPIGYEWSLRQGNRVIALKADYDKEYSSFSPGNVLAWHILQHFFANGVSEIDYGMGGGDYKKRWATDSYQLDELLIFNQSVYSRIWRQILSRQDQIRNFYNALKRMGNYLKIQRRQ